MNAVDYQTANGARRVSELRRFLGGAFGISWTMWSIALLLPQTAAEMPVMLIAILGGFGPFIAAAALLASTRSQRASWRDVIGPRLAPRWWVLLASVTALPALLSRIAPVDHPAAVTVGLAGLVTALAYGAIPAVAEELGWRGYALDRIRGTGSVLRAGLSLGLVWALWHLPLHILEGWWNADVLGLRWYPVFALYIVAQSILMAVAYYGTGRALLSAVLIHLVANTTISALALTAPEFGAMAVMWAVLAAGAVTWHGRRVSMSPNADVPTQPRRAAMAGPQ